MLTLKLSNSHSVKKGNIEANTKMFHFTDSEMVACL